MANPTKILSDRSWTDIMTSPKYDWEDKMFPVTQGMAKEFKDIVTWPADIPLKIYWWTIAWVWTIASPFVDAIWSAWNAALNWYKRIYNYWADLVNKQKLKQIEKEIKNFQKENPNILSQPVWKKFEYKSAADKVRESWAASDAEVREATHEFWYGNDPRTVWQRYHHNTWTKNVVSKLRYKKPDNRVVL